MRIKFLNSLPKFRLSFNGLFDGPKESVVLHPSLLKKLWLPDLFFANEKEANFHEVTQELVHLQMKLGVNSLI